MIRFTFETRFAGKPLFGVFSPHRSIGAM